MASNTAMRSRLVYMFSVRLFGFLLAFMPTFVFCQGQFIQNFAIADACRHYCPGPANATGASYAKSRIKCAAQCILHQRCICFSYYATSGLCYSYSFVPQEVLYDQSCTFMMDRDVLSGCAQSACMKQLCTCTYDVIYGCRNITRVNATSAVCRDPSGPTVKMGPSNLDLGNGSIPLPSVNNWIVVMQRFDGSLDFNQNWIAYRNGFGNTAQGEFWLGNEKIHILTSRPGLMYRLRAEVQLDASGKWYYADYSTFSLDSEANKYIIHISGYCGNAGDSLSNMSIPYAGSYHNGNSFTTSDADNDGSSDGNCAITWPGGWWFGNCYACCLTCRYNADFQWYIYPDWQTFGPLRAARMMIKLK